MKLFPFNNIKLFLKVLKSPLSLQGFKKNLNKIMLKNILTIVKMYLSPNKIIWLNQMKKE